MKNHRIYAYFLVLLALTKDYVVLGDPIPSASSSVTEGVANAVAAAAAPDDDRLNLLAFVNPCGKFSFINYYY